jgi:hypothetical protein
MVLEQGFHSVLLVLAKGGAVNFCLLRHDGMGEVLVAKLQSLVLSRPPDPTKKLLVAEKLQKILHRGYVVHPV